MRENDQVVYLKDYAPSPYRIERVELDARFVPEATKVRSVLSVVPREARTPGAPRVLDGGGGVKRN